MRLIIFIITLFIFADASSYKYGDISMEVDFYIKKENKRSKTMHYISNFAVYYDETKEFKEKIYCFNDKSYIFVTKNTKKPKYKICIDKANITKIYVMDKHFRYQKSDEFDIEVDSISLKVKDKESKNFCEEEAYGYNTITAKINKCLKKL